MIYTKTARKTSLMRRDKRATAEETNGQKYHASE
uniref:Uncharacterized protein n=1 Tax=Anguilla anguilla TaxID=7936 RepID=A0A0E9R762_ANGAN